METDLERHPIFGLLLARVIEECAGFPRETPELPVRLGRMPSGFDFERGA